MSFLRMLSPSRHTNSTRREDPTVTLHLPAYGVLYLSRAAQPFGQQDEGYGSEPFTLKGWVQVNIPTGSGKRKCRAITVGYRTVCRLAMGPERGWERDVIFEKEEHLEDEQGIILEEGSTRFEFAFPLPEDLRASDWHDSATVIHEIYALIESSHAQSSGGGILQAFRSASPLAGSSRSRSPNSVRSHGSTPGSSRAVSRSPSPQLIDRGFNGPSLSSIPPSSQLPQTPAYGDIAGNGSEEAIWLETNISGKRDVKVVWNPNPAGGVSSLDEKVADVAEDLGEYEVRFKAPIWTVCCLLHTRIRFLQLPSTAKIFSIRVVLNQTLRVRSPRNEGLNSEMRDIRSAKRHIISGEGRPPARDVSRPDDSFQVIWRNKGSGLSFDLVTKGRLPNDKNIRPSTLDGINTPAHVSHQLVVEVVYSIWNEDRFGQPLDKDGPGEQRMLSIARSVLLPGCVNIPERLSLPQYVADPMSRLSQPDYPCPLCGTPIEDRYCTICPFDRPIHPRHDHPKKLVGTADGTCPMCSSKHEHEGDPTWRHCACAMSLEEMEKLGESLERAGGEAPVQRWGDEEGAGKVEYERGRQFSR